MKTTNAFFLSLILAGTIGIIKPAEELSLGSESDYEGWAVLEEDDVKTFGLIPTVERVLKENKKNPSSNVLAFQLGEYQTLLKENGVNELTQRVIRTFQGDLSKAGVADKNFFLHVFGVPLDRLNEEVITTVNEKCATPETEDKATVEKITKGLALLSSSGSPIYPEKMRQILRQATIQASDLETFKILVTEEDPEPKLQKLFENRKDLFATCGYSPDELQTLINALIFAGMEKDDCDEHLVKARELLEKKATEIVEQQAPSYSVQFLSLLTYAYEAGQGLVNDATQIGVYGLSQALTTGLRPLAQIAMQLNQDYQGQRGITAQTLLPLIAQGKNSFYLPLCSKEEKEKEERLQQYKNQSEKIFDAAFEWGVNKNQFKEEDKTTIYDAQEVIIESTAQFRFDKDQKGIPHQKDLYEEHLDSLALFMELHANPKTLNIEEVD
jgi:hypothetical protein